MQNLKDQSPLQSSDKRTVAIKLKNRHAARAAYELAEMQGPEVMQLVFTHDGASDLYQSIPAEKFASEDDVDSYFQSAGLVSWELWVYGEERTSPE